MSPTESGSSEQPVIAVDSLSKSFDGTPVLRSIDFEVRPGKVLVLIGPSGSGKTTVLRCLNGLETPEGGTISAPGLTLDFSAKISRRQREGLRDRSAMVFQNYNLFPHLTVLENVVEGPVRVQGRNRAEAEREALELLDRVGVADKRDNRPFELSGGQQQRVGIVRALALRPQLLLFDEPTSSLDPELVGEVLTVMKELAEERWTMMLVTHELTFARQVADEVLFMDGGVIVERGAPGELFTAPRHPRTKQFLDRLLNPF